MSIYVYWHAASADPAPSILMAERFDPNQFRWLPLCAYAWMLVMVMYTMPRMEMEIHPQCRWRFPKIGLPPNHPFSWTFHYKPSSSGGTPNRNLHIWRFLKSSPGAEAADYAGNCLGHPVRSGIPVVGAMENHQPSSKKDLFLGDLPKIDYDENRFYIACI